MSRPVRVVTDAGRPHLLLDIDGPIATLTIDRPERMNALPARGLRELRGHLCALSDDPSVRVVVLTGAGRAFSAGGDVDGLTAGAMEATFVREEVELVEILTNLRPVTVAAVNGACAGGAMALACATDLRLAAASAFFTTAYLRIGTPGDLGLSWTLPRIVGLGRAKELCLLGDRVSAEEAMRIGLVSRVIPDAELLAAARALAERIAGFAPLAAAEMKRNLNQALGLPLGRFLDVESARFARNSATADAVEAAQAFVERRPPRFQGR